MDSYRSPILEVDDQVPWLITAVTLFPNNLEVNINLFRKLRNVNEPSAAAKVLIGMLSKFSSAEKVSAELKSLADDADEDRHSILMAKTTGQVSAKLQKVHEDALSIISKLPADIQAMLKLKSVGDTGSSTYAKRAGILCQSLVDSSTNDENCSGSFVVNVCSEMIERLIESPSPSSRHWLCEKLLPILLGTVNENNKVHPIVRRLPKVTVLKCLPLYYGHILLRSFHTSTATMVSIDRQWNPCLAVQVSCMDYLRCNISAQIIAKECFNSFEDLNKALESFLLRVSKLSHSEIESQYEILSLILILALMRNSTAYLRALTFPESELAKPVLIPSPSLLSSIELPVNGCEIVSTVSEDSSIWTALASAFKMWHGLTVSSTTGPLGKVCRRVEDIFVEIAQYFDDSNPLKQFEVFRNDAFIYHGLFEKATYSMESSSLTPCFLGAVMQKAVCQAQTGKISQAVRLILDVVVSKVCDPILKSLPDVDFDEYKSIPCFLFISFTPNMFAQLSVSLLKNFMKPKIDGLSNIRIISGYLLLCQADSWPTQSTECVKIIGRVYHHLSSDETLMESPLSKENELKSPQRLNILLKFATTSIFRPELIEHFYHLCSQYDTAKTIGRSLTSHIANVCPKAMENPRHYALEFMRESSSEYSSIFI